MAVDRDGAAVPAVTAYVTERRGVVSTALGYDGGYTGAKGSYALSPDLPMVAAQHHLTGLPGSFADSAPDRWGRNLIARRLRHEASQQQTPAPAVLEVDYLLGVTDATRQGALRFAKKRDGPYLDREVDVPQLIALPRLLRAADSVTDSSRDDYAAVKKLLEAGSGSLGGARPKASVRDGERLVDVSERQVLLLERFDRLRGARLGYISAMTLLRSHDGEDNDYLELAEVITEHGGAVAENLAQLWRRVAFLLIVNSVDDHMRNHGFLRGRGGWVLSPAFDINPEPEVNARRVTSVAYVADAESALDALVAAASYFRLSSDQAHDVLQGGSAGPGTSAG